MNLALLSSFGHCGWDCQNHIRDMILERNEKIATYRYPKVLILNAVFTDGPYKKKYSQELRENSILMYYYHSLGINTHFLNIVTDYCDLDLEPFSGYYEYDAIHIVGGNTFSHLYFMVANNWLNNIKEFVKNDGVLIGCSAGAILMSETCDIAQFADENEFPWMDTKSLGLVSFDVKPHYQNWLDFTEEFQEYSNQNKKNIFLLTDRDGIIMDKNYLSFYGKPLMIQHRDMVI